MSRRRSTMILLVLGLIVSGSFFTASASTPPFDLPMEGDPGPGTWYVNQWYGNTVTAARNSEHLYHRGQGVHFGVDFAAPCGTDVLAIGDGVVHAVDGPYGSPPHNLTIRHDNDYFSMYGHLEVPSTLEEGQEVDAGDRVGQVGDPAGSDCQRAPHLHLEIRTNDMTEAVNPVPLIDADWRPMTAGTEAEGSGFAVDFEDPQRWQRFDDQPDIKFQGSLLNLYDDGWLYR